MRTHARTRWERAAQVFRWAKEEFDLPDVRLEVVSDLDGGETFGDLILRNGRPVIRLSARACRTTHDAVFNVLHEAAHLRLEEFGTGYNHGPTFWPVFGEMVDAYDHHGESDSRACSCEF